MLTTGSGFTVMSTSAEAVQLLTPVTVTVYVPLALVPALDTIGF